MVAAMFEFARGPNLRHQHEAPKTEAVRPYKDAILQALRKTTLEEIARLLTKGGVEISKPQLARAVQLFKKETRAERAGTRSPTTQSSRDPKLHQLAAELAGTCPRSQPPLPTSSSETRPTTPKARTTFRRS